MNKHIILLGFLGLVVLSCGSGSEKSSGELQDANFASEIHQDFVDNLRNLCGQSFQGAQVYRSHHGESWADKKLIMHITVCEEDKVYIPFHVDEDHSRTWMFLSENGRLRFRHQHLHEDGTHEDDSMYGGYATDEGTEFVQYFPADDFTKEVIPGGGGNLWTVSMDEELTRLSYRLDRDGEKRFEIVFDLTKPLTE